MKKIAVITNFNIREKATAALTVCDRLTELGCEVYVASFNCERIRRNSGGRKYENINYISPERLYNDTDLIIILGGDGTILESARRAIPTNRPMLGINLGRLGYMAELEFGEIDRLTDIVNDKYEIDERMTLRVEILDKEGKRRFSTFALNDAVISNGSVARIVDIRLSEGGAEVSRYRADGVIVATPTGSTAYSMSAGGAIVDPKLECICLTPVCPHSLGSRPLIFPASASIELQNICEREKALFVTIDGRSNQEIVYGETVRITRSELKAKLVRLNNNGFYNKLRAKMNSKF